MSGFNKAVVVEALKQKLSEEVASGDRRHEDNVKEWEERRDEIQRAKKNTRQAVRDLTDGRIEVEEFATRLNSKRGYNHWFERAAEVVPPKPKRVASTREKGIERVISIIGSSDSEVVSVADLRGLGVLDFVKFTDPSRR